MAEADQDERSEEATQQRREDFRKRGQVAQTKELGSVLILLISMITIWLLGKFFLEQIFLVFSNSFDTYLIAAARDGDWIAGIQFAAVKGALIVGPLFLIYWLVGLSSSLIQIGLLHNEEALKLNWERINPIQGFQRLFNLKSVVEGFKAILKVSIVSIIVYFVLRSEFKVVPQLVSYSVENLLVYLGQIILRLFGGVGIFMATLAAFDYFYQRWELEKQMRMTKQEIKEEVKSREGDPMIRARIRRIQREMANKRMMTDVPKASVIITNPTHIAVALVYNDTLAAPKLIAKGAEQVAQKIKEIAREHNIPIIENKPLARAIFKTLKIGQTIPRELYTAVAEVLSYVFKLKKRSNI